MDDRAVRGRKVHGDRMREAPDRDAGRGKRRVMVCRCGRAIAAAARPHQAAAGIRDRASLARVPNARAMTLGQRRHAVRRVDRRRQGLRGDAAAHRTQEPARVRTIASGLRDPAGVAFRDGALYVSADQPHPALRRHRARLDAPPAAGRRHATRFRATVITAASSSRSVPTASCTFRSARRATSASPTPTSYTIITRMNPDGSGREIVARGVRNTVGFDWHPQTKELWFTDNGRDMLGDDVPPDELNRVANSRRALRLSVLPRRHDSRSRVRRQRPCSEFVRAGAEPRPARRRARHALLHGDAVPGGIPQPGRSSPSTARGTAARRSAIA